MLKVIRSQLHTLFLPALFWLAGITVATKISYHWFINLAVIVSFLFMIFLPKLRIYIILILILLLGWMHTTSYLQSSTNEIGYFLTNDSTINEVFNYKVLERKQTSSGKHYYIIKVKKLNDYPLKGKLLLYNAPDSLKLFHIYQTPLSVSNIKKANNPAEFDFQKYYQYAGIQGSSSANGLTIMLGNEITLWQRLKLFIISKIETTFKKDKSMALALFLGEKGILNINRAVLSEMGLLHLFAVSGLHVGIIYLTILTLLTLFINKQYARIIASLLLIFYGYLCGWSPSVFRTVLIIFIYNLTFLLQRKISFLQLISLTLFIITIINPLQIFSVGLQLSLSAFIALWLADRKIIPYLYGFKRKYKFNKYLFKFSQYLIYSLSVIIFIAPLSAYYFNIISLNAVITNFFATPIVMLMLNIILLSVFIPQSFIAQDYLAKAFTLLNVIFNKIIEYASFLPFFTRRVALSTAELIAIILLVLTSFFLFKRYRYVTIIFLVSVGVLFGLILSGLFVKYQNQVICFDAGKADCNYLEFAEGKNMLIDTGSQEQYPNIMQNSVIPYLKKRHIHNLDKVIITHAHEDHYGGLLLLTKNINIKEIVIHQTALKDEIFAKIIQDIETEINVTALTDTISFWEGKIRFLHPYDNYESSNMNNNSLVIQACYDDYKLLFTGDIEGEVEERIARHYGDKLQSDFLKIPHHGSITSSSTMFLEMVNPKSCFIPAGNSDRNKFPNPLVLKRLKNMNIKTWVGADDGALIMKITKAN